jgi:hypothetical protein
MNSDGDRHRSRERAAPRAAMMQMSTIGSNYVESVPQLPHRLRERRRYRCAVSSDEEEESAYGFADGDEVTIAHRETAIQHSLAGSDTYG